MTEKDKAIHFCIGMLEGLSAPNLGNRSKTISLGIKGIRELVALHDTLQEKPVSEGLEKTIDDYLATYFGGEKEKQYWPFLKKMAMYFSKLQNHLMTSFIEFYRNEHIKAAESAETERDKAMHQYAADICGVMLTQLNGQIIVKED